MRRMLIVAAVLAVVATCAMAQDIETTMAGRAQIGVGLLSEAWLQNPAALALNPVANGEPHYSVAAEYEIEGDVDLRTISAGGQNDGAGVGAGWVDVAGMDAFGIGAGFSLIPSRVALGANFQSVSVDGADDMSTFDVALAGFLPTDSMDTLTTLGIVARDVTGEDVTTYDAGLAIQSMDWRFAVDLQDVTDENETILQVGASGRFGEMREWQLGAGLDDGNITAGVVFHAPTMPDDAAWKLGVAFLDGDSDAADAWVVGAGVDW